MIDREKISANNKRIQFVPLFDKVKREFDFIYFTSHVQFNPAYLTDDRLSG